MGHGWGWAMPTGGPLDGAGRVPEPGRFRLTCAQESETGGQRRFSP